MTKTLRIEFHTITLLALCGLHRVAEHRMADAPAFLSWLRDTAIEEAAAREGLRDDFPSYDVPNLSPPELRDGIEILKARRRDDWGGLTVHGQAGDTDRVGIGFQRSTDFRQSSMSLCSPGASFDCLQGCIGLG